MSTVGPLLTDPIEFCYKSANLGKSQRFFTPKSDAIGRADLRSGNRRRSGRIQAPKKKVAAISMPPARPTHCASGIFVVERCNELPLDGNDHEYLALTRYVTLSLK